MRYAPLPARRTLFPLLLASFLAGGCAHRIPEVDPADIPRLQEESAADPENTRLQVQLGMAQYKAGDYEAARTALQAAVDAGQLTGPGLLYLGLTHEEFEDWTSARDAYDQFLQVGISEPLKEAVRGRLQLIGENVLRQQARLALQQESQITGADVQPRSVAVLPFGFNSSREEYQPLIYALADMMITDFAVSNALTVLERGQIQTLLDEMALTEAGYAESGTGARAGRLLGAEHVVQGVLTLPGEESLNILTNVLNVPNGSTVGSPSAEDELANLFDMEKDLVFRVIRDVLGIELTPAEEQQILDNRSDNVLAFLAYGRGLRERDRGNYAAAAQQFQQAQQLDPNFQPASDAANESQVLDQAANTDASTIVTTAATTGETSSGGAVAPPPSTSATTTATSSTTTATANTLSGASEAVSPTPTSSTLDLGSTQSTSSAPQQTGDQRDPVQESQGQDGVTKTATAQIRIVIKRPGGGQ